MDEFEVKDSGKMATYASGMRRDTPEGKPKFGLMFPRDVPYEEQLLTRVAMLYMRGGLKYGDRNWEKSCTEEDLAHHEEALWRHFVKFATGVEDGEDHAAAVVWNINAVLLTRRNIASKRQKPKPELLEEYHECDHLFAGCDCPAVPDEKFPCGHTTGTHDAADTAACFEYSLNPRGDCPDGGLCGHGCTLQSRWPCYRVISGPPSPGIFPEDEWPASVKQYHQDLEANRLLGNQGS